MPTGVYKKTKEHIRKIAEKSIFQKGVYHGFGFKKGMISLMKGKKHSPESIEKNRLAHIGKMVSEETRKHMSELRKNEWLTGKRKGGWKLSKETKIKLSEIHRGERGSNWRGGISFELYGFDWTKLLKHSIRTRDCFVCQICGKNGWIIHHIDYNKKNCNPDNLITLCNSCHAKTNFNRKYWTNYFYDKS